MQRSKEGNVLINIVYIGYVVKIIPYNKKRLFSRIAKNDGRKWYEWRVNDECMKEIKSIKA
jgi:hypothetical protein